MVQLSESKEFVDLVMPCFVALGGGLLVGAEREQQHLIHVRSLGSEILGIRTFSVCALMGFVAQVVGGNLLTGLSLLCIGGLLLVSYIRSAEQDPGLTTELALLSTFLLGALAVLYTDVAAALFVILAFLLSSKRVLHGFVHSSLSPQELRNALVLGMFLVVLLPISPAHAVDPFGAIVPQKVIRFVALMLAIDAIGQTAARFVPVKLSIPLLGFLGGLLSASATVATMGAQAKGSPGGLVAAVAGASFSTVATVAYTGVVVWYGNKETFVVMLPAFIVAAIVSIAYAAGWLLALGRLGRASTGLDTSKVKDEGGADPAALMTKSGRPLHIGSAFTIALLVSLTTYFAGLAGTFWGASGVLGTTFLAGFADAQSSAFSAASLVGAGVTTARNGALAVIAAFTANTITKIFLASLSGSRAYALRTIPGFLAVLFAIWISHLFLG